MELQPTSPGSDGMSHFFDNFSVEIPWKSLWKHFHGFSTGFSDPRKIRVFCMEIFIPRYRERGKWKTLPWHLPIRPDLLKSVWPRGRPVWSE